MARTTTRHYSIRTYDIRQPTRIVKRRANESNGKNKNFLDFASLNETVTFVVCVTVTLHQCLLFWCCARGFIPFVVPGSYTEWTPVNQHRLLLPLLCCHRRCQVLVSQAYFSVVVLFYSVFILFFLLCAQYIFETKKNTKEKCHHTICTTPTQRDWS